MKKYTTKKNRKKKGISVVIGYVLLVSFAVIIGVLVYAWMKPFVPKGIPECPDEISIFVKSYDCAPNYLNLTLENNGRFNIGGYYIYATTSPNQEFATLDISRNISIPQDRLFPIGLKFGTVGSPKNSLGMGDGEEDKFDLTGFYPVYSVTITPIRWQKEGNKEALVSCKNAVIKEPIICGDASACTPDCGSRECGNDPVCGTLHCGSLDGECPAGENCNVIGQCIVTSTNPVWSPELLTNPGFEWENLTGWTTNGANWAAGAHPWATSPGGGGVAPQAGSYCAYYAVGPSSSSNYIYQDVDLSIYASSIGAGTAVINASGWGVSAEYGSQDNTRIQIMFLDSSKNILSTPLDTGYNDTQYWWKAGIYNYPVLTNARYIRMWGNTYESCCDAGSLDSFSVKIRTQ